MTSLVQRKARTGSEIHAARAMSLARALRLTAAQQADQLMGMALSALSVTRRQVNADRIEGCLEDGWLTLLMDGAGEQVAAVLLDPVLVDGLIQQQTTAKVRPVLEGMDPRAHTATDAALCAPYIELLLKRSAQLPEDEKERELLAGYRFGVWAADRQQAKLALEAPVYDVVEMTLDLAAGVRVGKISLLLPEPVKAPVVIDEPVGEDPVLPQQGEKLTNNVMKLHAELSIALTRVTMPIHQVSELKAGDVLDLQISSMAQALVLDANGRALSRGTLGQVDGMRAVQVEQQKSKQHTQPRRRASDRAELDLPDVTAPVESTASSPVDDAEVTVPSISDVDIFGDIDELPDLPDIEEAAQAADDQVMGWERSQNTEASGEIDATQKQAGW